MLLDSPPVVASVTQCRSSAAEKADHSCFNCSRTGMVAECNKQCECGCNKYARGAGRKFASRRACVCPGTHARDEISGNAAAEAADCSPFRPDS